MKAANKRFLTMILSLLMLLNIFPLTVFAAENNVMSLIVSSVQGPTGSTVDVTIDLENNPGISSLGLNINYDDILTLESIRFNEAMGGSFTPPQKLNSPFKLIWYNAFENFYEDTTFVTLSFKISETAEEGAIANINVTYDPEDIYNMDEVNVTCQVKPGTVTARSYIPGDINGDQLVNNKDLTRLAQHLADWEVTVSEFTLDVNGDGNINNKDLTRLAQYLADWYVEIFPEFEIPSQKCVHSFTGVAAKAATCTEDGNTAYWQCTKCSKYFNDSNDISEIKLENTAIKATGHTPVIDTAVEATYTTTGLTEGSHCTICHIVLKEQQIIPVLQKEEYSATYHVANNDPYLAKLSIENTNSKKYTSQNGLVLQDLMVNGYNFKGWYTAQTGGTRVSEFPAGSTGDKVLYAQWEKVSYTVTFDSPDVPVASVTYTVDKGITLVNPAWYGYTFVGWSNDNGFITSSIRPGTTGNITLHANWTSNRNKATSYSKYDKPMIIEDDTNGQFVFVYDIGKIDNVPLSQIEYIGNTQTLNIDNTYEITDSIASDQAKTVANAVSNATTRSSGWTLSEDWNKIYSSGSEYEDTKIKTSERTDSEGNVIGGNYFVSNSNGGSSYVSTESGGSNVSSSKVTTENSKGINASYDTLKETYVDGKLGVSNTFEYGAGISLPVKIAEVSAEIKNTMTAGIGVSAGRKDNEAFHVDGQASSYVGTVDTKDSSSYYKTAANQSSTWNATSGYEKSYQTSRNTQVSTAISEQISKTTSYNVTDSLGGQNSKTESVAGTDTRKDEYSTTLKYSEGTSTTTKKHITFHSDRPGYYRLVTAGTVHVYGIVGYDVATASYYTYTFNVLDDERHEYLDYSKDNANFNDCENGVVAFQVPYEVNEYILGVTGKTSGLEFDLDGTVKGFEATKDFEGTVSIPQYYSVNNGDGTYSAFQTERFDADTFRGNKDIKTVILPIYVTEIPDNAFEGCANLEKIIAYGVTKIGNNAFKGCTSLNAFAADNLITSLGSHAFENTPEVAIMAANTAVADAAIHSGAKKSTLNLSKMEGSFDNKKITISDATGYFALISSGVAYKNLQIDSNAAETFISNMKFTNNSDTPLKLNSKKVILNRVTVENSPGFALILPAENTELKLFGTIALSSSGENSVISKNITLEKANPEVAGVMKVTGNYLVCGKIENEKMLTVTNGSIVHISEDEFKSMLTSSRVSFDANGGTVENTVMTVYYGQKYGVLPTPTRDNYNFEGWYTTKTDRTKITADSTVSSLGNQTLYAHWTPKVFNVTFNANGGNVSTSSQTLIFGNSYGALPTPIRDHYTFAGWYTAASGGTKVTSSTIPFAAKDVILFAQWTQKPLSSWVKVSEVPENAQVVNKKWSYDLTSYTTSGSSTMDGWTQYDQTSRWGDYGSWSAWQDGYIGGSDSRQVETQSVAASANYKTVYHYYRYSVNREGGYGSFARSSSYPNYYEFDFDSPLEFAGNQYGYDSYKWWYNGSRYVTLYQRSPFTTQEVVSYNYKTQYRYRDRSLIYTYLFKKIDNMEATSYPTGDNISNVQEWAQYRDK